MLLKLPLRLLHGLNDMRKIVILMKRQPDIRTVILYSSVSVLFLIRHLNIILVTGQTDELWHMVHCNLSLLKLINNLLYNIPPERFDHLGHRLVIVAEPERL